MNREALRLTRLAKTILAGETFVRYVHRDGKGLFNNSSLDRMKLNDDEEFELVELNDLGLTQPRNVPSNVIFAFTEEGERRHSRLIELLTKASIRGVRRIELDGEDYDVVWESGDGQVALVKD